MPARRRILAGVLAGRGSCFGLGARAAERVRAEGSPRR